MLKWFSFLLGSSIWILLNVKNRNYNRRKGDGVILWLILFIVVEALSTIETSSYPVTLFQIDFFWTSFDCYSNWCCFDKQKISLDRIYRCLFILFCINFVLIPFGKFRNCKQ